MKNTYKFKIFLLIMFFNTVNGQQNCREYIVDDWDNSRYRYEVVSGHQIVSDIHTGLIWKQCSQGLSGENCSIGSVENLTWKEALESSATTNQGAGFAGYNDWRVPNIKELNTILALNCFSPSINLELFPNTFVGNGSRYWSSTPVSINPGGAWVVDFFWGETEISNRGSNSNVVRLVRGNF